MPACRKSQTRNKRQPGQRQRSLPCPSGPTRRLSSGRSSASEISSPGPGLPFRQMPQLPSFHIGRHLGRHPAPFDRSRRLFWYSGVPALTEPRYLRFTGRLIDSPPPRIATPDRRRADDVVCFAVMGLLVDPDRGGRSISSSVSLGNVPDQGEPGGKTMARKSKQETTSPHFLRPPDHEHFFFKQF